MELYAIYSWTRRSCRSFPWSMIPSWFYVSILFFSLYVYITKALQDFNWGNTKHPDPQNNAAWHKEKQILNGKLQEILPTNQKNNIGLALTRHQPEGWWCSCLRTSQNFKVPFPDLLRSIQKVTLVPGGGILPYVTICNLLASLWDSSLSSAKNLRGLLHWLLAWAGLSRPFSPQKHGSGTALNTQPSPLRSSQEHYWDLKELRMLPFIQMALETLALLLCDMDSSLPMLRILHPFNICTLWALSSHRGKEQNHRWMLRFSSSPAKLPRMLFQAETKWKPTCRAPQVSRDSCARRDARSNYLFLTWLVAEHCAHLLLLWSAETVTLKMNCLKC